MLAAAAAWDRLAAELQSAAGALYQLTTAPFAWEQTTHHGGVVRISVRP
jgi:PPE-repeat protein